MTGIAAEELPGRSRLHRFGPRPLSLLLFVVLAAAAIGSAIAARNLVHDQHKKLLDGQAQAASAVLTSSSQTTQSTMAAAGQLALNPAGDPKAARAVAEPLLPHEGSQTTYGAVVLVDVAKAQPTQEPIAGKLDGDGLDVDERMANVQQAADCTPTAAGACMFSGEVFPIGDDRRFGFALGQPFMPKDQVVYYEIGLGPLTPTPNDTGPFADIDVILYAGDKVDPTQAIVTTTEGSVLTGGDITTTPVPNGMSTWTLAAKAKHSLVGGAADALPWILLGGGLLIAVLVPAIVETLLRRREPLEALVAERTAELSQSLNDLSAAQDQLVRSERLAAIGELTSTIGHELRNPLGVLTNAMYLLRQRLEGEADERALRHLATADREIAAATLIVSDLLEFAKAREPILEPVDVADLLAETESVAPPPTGVHLSREVDVGLPHLLADRNQLRQVFLNLVTNAYQAMPEGGTLTVAARSQDGRINLTFADTGQGMSEEVRQRVFEPFYTTKERGIGLGLAVTYRLVDTHGGSIDVTSVQGAGTTFTLRLPAAQPTQPTQPTSPSAAEPAGGLA